MKFRFIAPFFFASVLSACSGGGMATPAAPAAKLAAAKTLSAVRAPATELDRAQRSRLDTGVSPYPLSALAWPLSALAWPLSALAWTGTGPVSDTWACGSKGNGADCKSHINVTPGVFNPDPNAAPSAIAGVQPGLLSQIYNLPDKGGDGQTIALIVAYDNPNAESDLAIYRNTFGLSACTSLNGCFSKIAGSGSQLPTPDANWSVESSLDLDAVSAACQKCNIMLVEAASNQIPDLAAAVDTAVAKGATVVSNSYGVAEAADNAAYAPHFVHPGVPIVAAAGDVGYGVQFPAAVPTVTAVGGTRVEQLGNNAVQEIVWSQTGSGCSQFFAKPAWQTDTGCAGRTVNDIALLADPADGLAVYDSTLPGTTNGGWSVIGGTSMSTPLIASMFAIGSKHGRMATNASIYAAAANIASGDLKKHRDPSLLSIVGGSNGTCSVTYLCTGVAGYNGPTGNGVPWGTAAFAGNE